jgi:hypothetical protein
MWAITFSGVPYEVIPKWWLAGESRYKSSVVHKLLQNLLLFALTENSA